MAGSHEAVDQRLVLGREAVVQRADVVFPLFHGARAGDGAGDEAVVEHPGGGELAGGDAGGPRALSEFLGDMETFGAPLGFQHALVLAAGAGALRWRDIGLVLAGKDAPGQRAVGEHAQAEMGASGEVLDLGHTVEGVVIGLAHHRAVDARVIAEAADFGDAPGAVVGDAEMADLALPHEVGHGMDDLAQRRAVILLVEVQNVDGVHPEALEAGLDGGEGVAAGQTKSVGAGAGGIGELGGQDPPVAVGGDGAANDFLRRALVIDVRRVDEVDALVSRAVDDEPRRRFVGLLAEHHGAQAERRDLEAAAS